MLTTLLMASLFAASPALPRPEETRYFFILFGCQSHMLEPRTGHTWAMYVKVTPSAAGLLVEPVTVSWLPADGEVEPFRLRTVSGKNYSVDETFAIARSQNARVSMWGPYEIDAERYHMAVSQVNRLDSGAVQYRVFDSLRRNHTVCHCVHAVTYADPVLRHRIQPVLQVGERGTSKLAAKYERGGAFDSSVTHDWLIPVLGLDAYTISRREPGERVPRRFR